MSNLINLTGKQFGRLLVVERAEGDSWGSALWKCLCSCGNTLPVSGASLRYGRTNSCGCLMREVVSKRNTKPNAARNKVLGAYKSHAKGLKLPFRLSTKVFSDLIFGNCYYCGQPPSRECRSFAGNCIKHNGIDRLNSKLGYTKHNFVSCCSVCNYMKKAMSLKAFVEHVKQIAEHLRGKK